MFTFLAFGRVLYAYNHYIEAQLLNLHAAGGITLLFAAHDEVHNNAVVLHDLLLRQ